MTSKTNGKIVLTEKLLHDSALKKLQLANTAASQVAESKESADSGFTPQACGFSPAQWQALSVDARLLVANKWIEKRRAELKAKAERESAAS